MFCCFLNARSIWELMLCNPNLTKLVYQTLLSFDCRAWALKLSEHLKKTTKLSIKIRLKRILTRQLKRIIIQCKISYMRKTYFYFKNVLLYTINNISMLLEIIISYFSCILKMMSRNTFHEPQCDSASYLERSCTVDPKRWKLVLSPEARFF